jgi:hypothetical protein
MLDIDAHGRVVPRSDGARSALADRAGRFALLPSTGDLLLARRLPAAGGDGPRPRCVLAGDLSGVGAADLVTFVHQARLSGVLTIAAGGAERSVVFSGGEVRGARSTAAGERLGEIAVRLGLLGEPEIAAAVRAGAPIGKALVDGGHLAPADLWRCLHEQVTAIFHAMLLAREGTFFLVEEDSPDRTSGPLAVSTQSLLMEGIRRIDELTLFQARIPGADAVVRRRQPKRAHTLRGAERAVLALVDDQRTVGEIAAAAHLSDFDATRLLHHLSEIGYVEALADRPRASSPEARLAEVMAAMNGLLRRVAAAVPEASRPAFVSAVRTFLATGANPYAPIWARAGHADDCALDEAAVLANVRGLRRAALVRLAPSGDRARALLEALRELLFFELFLASARIDPETELALGAELRRELERLDRRVAA